MTIFLVWGEGELLLRIPWLLRQTCGGMLVAVARRRGAGASDLGDENCEAGNLVNEIKKKVVSGTREIPRLEHGRGRWRAR